MGGLNGPFPSVGCEIVPSTFQDFFSSLFLPGPDVDPVNIQKLDAGAALNLAGPVGARQIPRSNTGDGGFKYTPTNGGIFSNSVAGIPGFPVIAPDYLQPGGDFETAIRRCVRQGSLDD